MNVIDLSSDEEEEVIPVLNQKSKGSLLLEILDEVEERKHSSNESEDEVIVQKKRKSLDDLLSTSLLPPKRAKPNAESAVATTAAAIPTASSSSQEPSASREEIMSQLDKDSKNEYQARARGDFARDELQIVMDADLLRHCGNSVLTDKLKESFKDYSSSKNSISHSIVFYRKLPHQFSDLFSEHYATHHSQSQNEEEEELLEVNYIVVLFTAEMIYKLMESKSLQQYVNQIKQLHPIKTIVLLVEGIHQYVKTLEQARYKKVLEMQSSKKSTQQPIQFKKVNTLQEIDTEIVELELNTRCLVYHCKNVQESICAIVNICKSIAEVPYKSTNQYDLNLKSSNKKTSTAEFWTKYKRLKEKNKENEELEEEEDSDSIALIKSLQMKEVWVKQLMEIPKVSENAAKCIAEKYPTLASLMRQYLYSGKTEIEKRELLKELKIHDARKVGPSISNKVYEFFTMNKL